MRLVAVDGMCLDLPDTPENGAEFGYPGNDAGRGPFPQIRVVGLGECGTRAVLGAATVAAGRRGAAAGPPAAGQAPAAATCCWPTGTSCPTACSPMFSAAGVHVLWRAKSDVDLPVLEVLPDGTYLSRIADPAASRRMRRKGAARRTFPASPSASSSTR